MSAAFSANSALSFVTVVSAGLTISDIAMLSMPTTETSFGTSIPILLKYCMTPIAIMSFAQTNALGRSERDEKYSPA